MAVLKYAYENECPWDEQTCEWAARGGHLDVLKYAHENECPWDEKTCMEAAEGGHLDVLKYARENECPWNKKELLGSCIVVANTEEIKAWIRTQPDE